MRALTKKSVKDVTRRKLRTILTILGIAVGVMGLTAINVASAQLAAGIAYTNDASAQPDIAFVTSPADPALADTLAAQPNVKATQAETRVVARWAVPTGHFSLAVAGLTDGVARRIGTFQVTEGTLPGPGEILLESGDRGVASVKRGDIITIQVGAATQRLTVSGFARTAGLPAPTTTQLAWGYMPQADLATLAGVSGANTFLVQLRDYGQRHETAKQLASVLEDRHVSVLATDVGRASDSGSQTIDGLFSVMRVLSIVALLLSIFLLLSTITTLVAEQVPVIGTLKAIGAVRGQVLRVYLTSVAIYGIAGTLIGLLAGFGLGELLFSLFAGLFTLDPGPLAISPSLVITAAIVGIGVPLAAALLPVLLGTRITVRQALSGYGLANGAGSAWASAIGRVFAFVPQTVQLGMRGLFRKRTRATLTLLALAVAGAAFLAVQTTAYSFGQTLAGVFDTYHADVFAAAAQPASYTQMRATLDGVPGVARTEPLAQEPVQADRGELLLTGVLPSARLYNKQIVSGRWFTADDTNVALLSEDAARKLGLKVGDSISFRDDLHAATWTIIGIARDYNGITVSGVLLAPLAEVNTFRHLPADYTSAVLIQSTSTDQREINALSARVDDAFSAAGFQGRVLTIQQIKAQNQSVFTIIYTLLYAVAAIIALVGGIGLFNSLAMSVLERRREIGILRSMGATGGKVAQVFWTEALSLSGLAWLVALALGIPAAYGFVQLLGGLFLPVAFAFNPAGLVVMLAFILIVASAASLGPVIGAYQTRIAQTLRYE